MKKGTISVTVDNLDEIRDYAKVAGLETPSALLRFATVQYMRRYPKKDARAVQPQSDGGN